MSLRSVVKSKVRRSNSRESKRHETKPHRSEGEDRQSNDSRGSPKKMNHKHSDDRSRSEDSVDRSARDSDRKDQRQKMKHKHSDDRSRSEDSVDRSARDSDRKDQRQKMKHKHSDDRSRSEDSVDRSAMDSDRKDQRQKMKHKHSDDRSRSEDSVDRSARDSDRKDQRQDCRVRHDSDERSGQHDGRSRRNGGQSRHDNNTRSRRDDDRSRQDDDRSRRNDNRSRQRDGNNDRTRHGDRRLDRGDENKNRGEADEKSKDVAKPSRAEGENPPESKRGKPSLEGDLATRTGGAYIPPARLRMMQEQITDKSSAQYQRIAWEALKKSINGLINKINVSNLMMIVRELLQENIVRGRGVLARSIMQAQAASPTFTHVYAALVSIINTKFPNIGELIVKRLIVSFKKGFRRNEKAICLSSLRFIAHLFNQLVCHEVLALQVLMLLVSQPTDDSVEVAVGFLKECGNKLKEVSPKSLNAVFESLRTVLHEATIDKRVQYMIEVMFAIRKDGFKDHPSVIQDLDLVEEDDQYTHVLKLDDPDLDPEEALNVFKFDPQYLENEEKYKAIKKDHLDEGDSDDEDAEDDVSGEDNDEDDDEDEDGDDDEGKEKTVIIDNTETNLVAFRRTLYLTIQSSLDFEECAHKIRKMDIKPGQEDELCNMILDCCAQQRTYEKFFGLLAQRFCMMEKKFMEPYQRIFQEQYDTVHRLETNKLRNVAKFYSHLLYTDAIEWKVLECIRLNEDDTTSSGRIFIKILFQELSEYMGLSKLNDRLKDVTLQPYFEGLFPRDNPRNTRFAINFFTSIGLGGLTDELRDHLKSVPKQPMRSPTRVEATSSESSEDDSESSSSDSSDSSSSDSEPSPPAKKRRSEKSTKMSEKSHKSEGRRQLDQPQKSEKSRISAKSEKSRISAKSSQKLDGPTSMQLRLMKLASYGQPPEKVEEETVEEEKVEEEKVEGRDRKRAHDRRQEVHPKRSENKQGRRRGQDSDSDSVQEKEPRKKHRKPSEDRREDRDRGQIDKRKHEDSESDGGQKRSSKRRKDSPSESEGERKGRPNHGEGRGRERSGDRTKERRGRRSRS